MRKWMLRIVGGTVYAALVIVIAAPWIIHWVALAQIDGRPAPALRTTFAVEDAKALLRKLREPYPLTVQRISPHTYIWLLVGAPDDRPGSLPPGMQLAWKVASAHNVKHLRYRDAWHFSGAALTIWLTRNWTTDELIAKAIELDQARRPAAR